METQIEHLVKLALDEDLGDDGHGEVQFTVNTPFDDDRLSTRSPTA